MTNTLCIAQIERMTQDLLGSRVAARLLDVDRVTIVRWVKDGKLKPVGRISDTPTGAFLFKRSDVEKLVKARGLDKPTMNVPLLDDVEDPDSVAQPASA